MRIRVTQENINKGKKIIPCECPVALAIEQAIAKPDLYVFVHNHDCTINDERYELPPVAQAFVRTFDLGLPVEPFEFELPIAA